MLILILLVTTDVQSASICQVEGTRNFLILCSYVEGSDAGGCAYTILANGVEIVSGTIARNNTVGVFEELVAIDALLLYDLESDSTLGTLPIMQNITFNIPICPLHSTTINTTTVLAING